MHYIHQLRYIRVLKYLRLGRIKICNFGRTKAVSEIVRMTPKGMCSMLGLAKHDASLCINNPRKVLFSTIRILSTGFITRHYTNQTWASRASRWTRYFLRAWRDRACPTSRPLPFFGQKIIFHFPESWNQATMLNKWSSWSRFGVRKFSMIRRTLHNTWFGTKISRAFSLVCIWPFYLRFVVSDPLMAPIFPWWRQNKPSGFRFQWHRFSRRQVLCICRNAHFCAKIRALQSDGNIFETKDYIFFLVWNFL